MGSSTLLIQAGSGCPLCGISRALILAIGGLHSRFLGLAFHFCKGCDLADSILPTNVHRGQGQTGNFSPSCIDNFQVRRLGTHWLWGATTGCSIGSSSTPHSTDHTRLIHSLYTHSLSGCCLCPNWVHCLHSGCPLLCLCNYGRPKSTQRDCTTCTTFDFHVP